MKRAIILLLTLCLAVTAPHAADAARKKKAAQPQPDRSATLVVDAYTGAILSQKNADAPRYPASLTKMMTLYMTFDALKNGQLRKNDRMDVSARASAQSPSKLNLRPGGSLRVEDGILALVTKSANDAAVVMAEAIGGSESHFASMMTQKARELGMSNTRFVNASGLHNPAQVTTARDMATLGLALLRDFPNEYRYFSTASFSYAGAVHQNHNHLMKTYDGMDGIKTGFIYASGYNLVASAKRGNHRLIGVVFGGNTAQGRNKTMADILDDGFESFSGNRTNIAAATTASTASAARPATIAPAPSDARSNASNTTQSKKRESANSQAQKSDRQPAGNEADEKEGQSIANREEEKSFGQKVVASHQSKNQENGKEKVSAAEALTMGQLRLDHVSNKPAELPTAVDQGDADIESWTVQIGAFSNHEASVNALQNAQKNLSHVIAQRSKPVVAPLMTKKGIVYRARFRNLSRSQATETCQKLKDGCLILSSE